MRTLSKIILALLIGLGSLQAQPVTRNSITTNSLPITPASITSGAGLFWNSTGFWSNGVWNANQFTGPGSIKDQAQLSNTVVYGILSITNPIAGSNGSLRLYAKDGFTEFVNGEVAGSSNRITFSIGSNTVAVGQLFSVHSTTIVTGTNNIVVTNLGSITSASIWSNSSSVIAPAIAFNALRVGMFTGIGATYWDSTNVGAGSTALGSNNLAGAYMSAVLSGAMNQIPTNSPYSVIVGGETNIMGLDGFGHNFIGGGWQNVITAGASNNIIVGGRSNVIDTGVRYGTISGGESNRIKNTFGTVGGGHGNSAGGDASTVAGGFANIGGNTSGSDWVFIGGGDHNVANPDYSTIAGGQLNFCENNATYGFIGGGQQQDINGAYAVAVGGAFNLIGINDDASAILAGFSNNIAASTTHAVIIGNFGTNSTSKSILLSPIGTAGNNMLHVTSTASTNLGPLLVQAGNAFSPGNFAGVGGVLKYDLTLYTNLNGAGTMSNLANFSIRAHTLTNNGDTVRAYWAGTMPAATANTNQFQIVYGSQTILDTGLQIASNCNWRAEVTIIRSGSTAQHAEGHFEWGPGGAVPFVYTNSNLEIVQTNGIATLLALKGGARIGGAHTNNSFRVYWDPSMP